MPARQNQPQPRPAPAELFPIRVLSERTGVGTSTLRAWERRYGLLKPARTPKGHRLYGPEDVSTVERALELLKDGHSLPSIARQIHQGNSDAGTARDRLAQSGVWRRYLEETLRAIADFSHERIEAVFNEATSLYPVELVTERLIEPVLVTLGEQWSERRAGIAEEHFYSSWVRNRLGARFHHGYGQARGARIVCACTAGNAHDIGLLLFSISALTRGYRVLYFGPDLPLHQVEPVLQSSGARGVVLSASCQLSPGENQELAQLAGRISVPLMLGGPGADHHLPEFEAAGGIRLGSRIAVALQILMSRIPAHGSAQSPPHDTFHAT
jgi:DNA-binding transcriptional MerR regulator